MNIFEAYFKAAFWEAFLDEKKTLKIVLVVW